MSGRMVNPFAAAFPCETQFSSSTGLTKRELIAAMVMQGLAANPGGPWQANNQNGWALANCTLEDFAEVCTDAANALLAELAKDGAA